LDFVISEGGLKMDPEKIRPIIKWHVPKNIFEVRIFHSLVSFYRKFIKNFNNICAPVMETIE